VPVVDERHLPEADPRHHAANETRLFGQRQERIERPPAHQPEIAGVERNGGIGHAVEQAVEGGGRYLLEQGFARALAADRVDHVGILRGHHRAHVRQQFGRVLQIGVDDEDLLARAQVEPGGQRELVAVVARQVDRDEVRIGGSEALHHRPAIVLRSVVDEQDLEILAHRRPRRAGHARVKLVETGGLVIAGDDDGQGRALHGPAHSALAAECRCRKLLHAHEPPPILNGEGGSIQSFLIR
jgi:hypothetical protein